MYGKLTRRVYSLYQNGVWVHFGRSWRQVQIILSDALDTGETGRVVWAGDEKI
jgi:hypothetical protein